MEINKKTQKYVPEGYTILYVSLDNPYMTEAKNYARHYSLDSTMLTGAVVVKENIIIGRGANGSDYHSTHECERVKQNIPSGERYDLCEGCSEKNHAEPSAIRNTEENGHLTEGADMYLWGHYYCCEWCWGAIIKAGIKQVYLMEGSEILFDKNHPDNIVGKQFSE